MNNLSDSENNNIDDNKNKLDTQKKRGRPRKNLFFDKSSKSSEKKEITNDEKDIILHLPVFLPKNKKTDDVSDVSDSENNDNEETVLSASDNESDDNDDVNYKKLYEVLLKETKKKDEIIKNFSKDIRLEKNNTSDAFNSDIQKDLTKHPINMKLVDNNTGKILEQTPNVCCWWCTYNFDSSPCFIPEKYYEDKYYIFGCFCSFNCAASYNLNMNDYKVMERYALLKKLYNQNSDKRNKLAPPKEVLEKYGGIVSIENYRKNFQTCDKEYRINLPPLVSLTHIIDEITIEKNENNQRVSIANMKKKLPVVKNNLFSTMGIKNK
jgi:hypothetical protein